MSNLWAEWFDCWVADRRIRRVGPQPSPVHAIPDIVWNTLICTKIVWGKLSIGPSQVYRQELPVRVDMPQLLQYTFRDQNKAVIDLTGYSLVYLYTKCNGQAMARYPATFAADRTTGTVTINAPGMNPAGVWDLQFCALDSGGTPLWGDPAEIVVAANVPNLMTPDVLIR